MKLNHQPRRRRKPTIREHAEAAKKPSRKHSWRRSKPVRAIFKPFRQMRSSLSQSIPTYQPESGTKMGGFLLKNRSLIPSYVRGAAHELRQVTWPSLPVALRLTIAVYVFALVFALLVAGLDWLLNHAFEEIILNKGQNIKDFIEGLF